MRKYYFDIEVKTKVKTSILASTPEEASEVLNKLDWKVKLDAVGQYEQIDSFDQAKFDPPNIVFTGSAVYDGEPIWYCNNFCELKGDNILYAWIEREPSLLVSKYGFVQSQTVDSPIEVDAEVIQKTQNALDLGQIYPYCLHCHRKAKRAVY